MWLELRRLCFFSSCLNSWREGRLSEASYEQVPHGRASYRQASHKHAPYGQILMNWVIVIVVLEGVND
jgi:hypothetical protein